MGGYLVTLPTAVVKYEWQKEKACLHSLLSDLAGCRQTLKSTSGGVIMLGKHYIKSWNSTQKTVALSTGEVELTNVVKGSSDTIAILCRRLVDEIRRGGISVSFSGARFGGTKRSRKVEARQSAPAMGARESRRWRTFIQKSQIVN